MSCLPFTMSAPTSKKFGKSTREVPHHSQKAQKWYPADDESKPKTVSGYEAIMHNTIIGTGRLAMVHSFRNDCFAWRCGGRKERGEMVIARSGQQILDSTTVERRNTKHLQGAIGSKRNGYHGRSSYERTMSICIGARCTCRNSR